LFVLCGGVVVRPVRWRATIVAQVARFEAAFLKFLFERVCVHRRARSC
jgi:hypothetical protein